MTVRESLQAAHDYWRPNRRELKKYLIQDGKVHPVTIICPGGGYFMCCSFLEGQPIAQELNKQGYSAVVLYYRCRSKARFPAPMEDLAWAVREVIGHAEEWKLDVSGYSVWGSSAGGHLVASFGTESIGYASYGLPKPGALILSYPVVTMGKLTHAGSRENLLGKAPTQAEIDRTSIELQVTKNYPPTFLWYGDADKVVPPENSKMLYAALQQHEIPSQMVCYPGVDHGVGLGTGLACEGWHQKALDFWAQQRSGK